MRPFSFAAMKIHFSKIPALLLLALLMLAAWALVPGSSGGFLFDDYVNLDALGEYGRVDNFRTLAYYLTVGLGDPLGRPLSMASFLLDARDWPAAPEPFLRTNILLHLLNGTLLALALISLGAARAMRDTRAKIAAVLAASLWLLHPLFLSTTLYIVQRESMLESMFVLLGLLGWLAGRSRIAGRQTFAAIALLTFGSAGCTAFAMLCKANGILLPLLLLVAECTLLPPFPDAAQKNLKRARYLLLGVPIAVLVVSLLAMLPVSINGAKSFRAWTLGERLLTEPRVIFDYVRLLLLPRPLTSGLFQDDFPVSSDLFHPWTTLPSVVALLGIGTIACWRRRQWPIACFAVLFFLAGHSLEAGPLALELYFEHRNYLPAMPVFWPLALWLTAPGPLAKMRHVAAAAIILLLTYNLRTGASIWGQPDRLAYEWAARTPKSPRAQANAAQFEMAQGEYGKAELRLRTALLRRPFDAQLALNLADAECASGAIEPKTSESVQQSLRDSNDTAKLAFTWVTNSIERAKAGSCRGFDLAMLAQILKVMRSNPSFAGASGREQDFDYVEGMLDLARHDQDAALVAFDRGIERLPHPGTALKQAAQLAGAGRPDLGLRHLETFERMPQSVRHPWPKMVDVNAWLLQHWGYWDTEIASLHGRLAEDAAHMQDGGLIPPTTPQ